MTIAVGESGALEGNMTKDIQWLGHDTFKILGDRVVYTDPFRLKAKDAADIIFITHEHHDHCSPEDVQKILQPDTIIVAPADCADIEIEVVPAYNTNKQFHTKDMGWVGYIFAVNNKRLYLAGDTDFIPEMKTLRNIDIALLPVSGTYVMTAEEAAEAALTIRPKTAIPMHYGTIVGSRKDAEIFAEKLRGKVDVIILPPE
jgi:L-ascorbate metabolism protein UlaG (beta-lactamase superfamily)